MKLLTVTVPCYNSAEYMSKCIDSLLTGGDRVEIIVIDDGSTDATGQIAERYAAEHPTVVRVVHQQNGGHGEGINVGLALATGKYFKVVDSDDWVDTGALSQLLDAMEDTDADMFVTNYIYTHDDSKYDSVNEYGWEFRDGKATTWSQTRPFRPDAFLSLHSVTFSLDVCKRSGVKLPAHTFYEDNLFVYVPMKYVETFRYLNVDLYRYYIGREGQSVQTDVFASRYAQQVKISLQMYKTYDFADEIMLNEKRGKYLYHDCRMLLAIATAAARLNGSDEAEQVCKDMWNEVVSHDPVYGKRLRYCSPAALQTLPGEPGRKIANSLYKLTRKLIKS